MSFRDLIFGKTSQAFSGSYKSPSSAWDDIDRRVRTEIEQADIKESRIANATEYWRVQLENLSDRHAAAISDTMKDAMELGEDMLQSKLSEQEGKIWLAHRILLQHSDTRWGQAVTDEALENIQRLSSTFRKVANVKK